MEAFSFAQIPIDRSRPLQPQLHSALLSRINEGLLPAGTRLPSSRRLADELGVSRNTVLIVIDQLKAEGYLESRPGSGVAVKSELPAGKVARVQWQSQEHLPPLSRVGQQWSNYEAISHEQCLPFTVGVPDLKAFPDATWLRLQRRHQERMPLRGFQEDQGYQPLRESLTHYLKTSRGVICDADQIIITQGAQQALALCALVLLDEGDTVMLEEPGYRGARDAFKSRNAHFYAVGLGDNGIDVTALPQSPPGRLLYTTPTHQYPLGGILPAADRLRLLDWAARHRLWVIEDDYDSEFHFHAKPIAALQGMAEQTPVLYMGSFSKTLYPALRLGYLVVPKPLVPTLVAAKRALGGETPLLTQAVVADFIAEGHFIRHLRRMRQLYQCKWDHLRALVEDQLKGLATPVARSAGMHLALMIDCQSDVELASEFRGAGFGSTPLSWYYASGKGRSGLVLGFANTSEAEREEGISVLRDLIPRC
jgi:GntR family transcriptional regulator/MocR family aminotransferase